MVSPYRRDTPTPPLTLDPPLYGFELAVTEDVALRSPYHDALVSCPNFASQHGSLQHASTVKTVFPFTAYVPSPPISFSLRNTELSGPAVPSVPPGPSELFAHAPWYPSADNVSAARRHSEPTFASQRGLANQDTLPQIAVSGVTSGPVAPKGSHSAHIMSWFQVLQGAVVVNGPRAFVPQMMYQPHSNGDKERYVSQATLQAPIIFMEQGSLDWGIPIQRLLSNELVRLDGGSELAFASCSSTIGIRIHWPGYLPWHKQVPAKGWGRDRPVISKAKLANVVAKQVKKFMDAMSGQTMEFLSDERWRIGPNGIRADDVVLVSVHHVSQGSWQPQLRLRRAIGTNVVSDAQSCSYPGRAVW